MSRIDNAPRAASRKIHAPADKPGQHETPGTPAQIEVSALGKGAASTGRGLQIVPAPQGTTVPTAGSGLLPGAMVSQSPEGQIGQPILLRALILQWGSRKGQRVNSGRLAGSGLGRPDGYETDTLPSNRVLQRLTGLELSLLGTQEGPEAEGRLRKVRRGLMVLTDDSIRGLSSGEKGQRLDRALLTYLGSSLIDPETGIMNPQRMGDPLHRVASRLPLHLDIHAFVQAVLRESYLLQSESLRDYAEKVQYFNELRGKMLTKVRLARQWAAEIGEEAWVFDEPLDVWDPDSGVMIPLEPLEFEETEAEAEYSDEAVEGSEQGDSPLVPEGTGQAAAASGSFSTYVAPGEDDLRSFLSALDSLSTWSEKRNFISNNVHGQGRALFENSALLSDRDFAKIAKALFESNHDEKTERIQNCMYRLLEGATCSQLEYLKSKKPQTWSSRIAEHGRVRLENLLASEDALQSDLPTSLYDADLDRARGQIIAILRDDEFSGFAYNALRQDIRGLSPSQQQLVLLVLRDLGARESWQEGLFFSLDPAESFRNGPEGWGFLAAGTDRVQEFYRSYRDRLGAPHVLVDISVLVPLEAPELSAGLPIKEADLPGIQFDRLQPVPGQEQVANGQTADNTPTTSEASENTGDMDTLGANGGPVEYRKQDFEAYIKSLEDGINQIGGDSQLAQLDLQNSLQQQQRSLQLMSNIGQMLHETALSIIKKIGS